MAPSNSHIDKLDFDHERRPLIGDDEGVPSPGPSNATSCSGSFFEQVVEGIQDRDRRLVQRETVRYGSFVAAILSCLCCGSITAYSMYGHLFMSELKYSQAAVNIISISAEIAMYLPVPIFGYICDRYGTRLPSLLAGVFFGAGYFVAALAYRSGPPKQLGGTGWPFWAMVCAFIAIGMGTSCMYLSAVSTCAKNFGRGNHKGVALAMPIAAFGLSGMLVSQIGSHLLYTTRADGSRGDVNVFKFFLFLAIALFVMGLVGAFALKVVDEGEMIEEAIDELEQSGLLDEGDFFRRAAQQHGYGTMTHNDLSTSTVNFLHREAEELKRREAEEQARKDWLLNAETRRFLKDQTVWWLALGFFLVTGPGEAFINNMGTVIGTLYPPSTRPEDIPTSASTHVSIIALSSTVARLLTGTITDLLAPSSDRHQHNRGPNSLASSLSSLEPRRWSVSRIWFLLASAAILSTGQILLASGLVQNHGDRFWVVSALIGTGYGAIFSLTPIIVSVIWGVENFGTAWSMIATVPAAGAAVWGVVYSAVYQAGASLEPPIGVPEDRHSELCFGPKCYTSTFWAMAASVWIACGVWIYAWKGPGGWTRRGVAV